MIKVKNIPLNFLIQCIFILFLSHSALAATKADSAKENLNAVHEKIDQLKKELSGTQKAQEDATDQLKKAKNKLAIRIVHCMKYQFNKRKTILNFKNSKHNPIQ